MFKPGQSGNPSGRPKGVQLAANRILTALADACTDEAIQEMVAKFVELAKNGDHKAFDILLDRILGKPRQPVDTEIRGAIFKAFVGFDPSQADTPKDDPPA